VNALLSREDSTFRRAVTPEEKPAQRKYAVAGAEEAIERVRLAG
jgi:hypothetical protein